MDVLLLCSMFLMFHHVPAADSVHGKLLFASVYSIMEVDIDTRNVTTLVMHGDANGVLALDYDYENRYVYVARFGLQDIVRFSYPSKSIQLEHVVKTSYGSVGLAVDSINDHVYWVYNGGNILSRCRSDGTNVVVVHTSLIYTYMIRLDITNRWMYLADPYRGISKSRFDLTDISIIANFTLSNSVFTMDIDMTEQILYWIDYDGDFKSVKEDGSDVKTIISTNHPSRNYYGLNVMGNYVYYAERNQIFMRNKSQESTPTDLYTDTLSLIRGIHVLKSTAVDPTTPTKTSGTTKHGVSSFMSGILSITSLCIFIMEKLSHMV